VSAGKQGAAIHLGQAVPSDQNRTLRPWWSVITIALVAAVFVEAVFAGAMLSGAGWARQAHALTAGLLIASTLIAGLLAIVTLRRVPHGATFGLMLLGLAAAVFIQAAVGVFAAKGTHLLWVHVPLGVALVGLAGQAVAAARRLGGR